MVHRSIQFFPQKFSDLQRQVAVGAVFFGEGDRAGVEVEVSLAKRLPGGHVGVAMQQNVAGLQRRQVGSVVHMAVGGVNQPLALGQHRIICHDGKVQHHLVYLAVAVAAHAEDAVLALVQHRQHLFGGVAFGQVVAGAVVQNITQQK